MKLTLKDILNNKRFIYLSLIIILALFSVTLNLAFSAFTNRSENKLTNINVAGMKYNIFINGLPNSIITSPKNDTTKSNITINSLNNIDSKYELIYKVCTDINCNNEVPKPENLTIEYSSRTIDQITDIITKNGVKNIRIITTNNTNQTYYIKLDLNAGYSHNTLALQNLITTEYNEEDVTIAAIIDGEISTTFPTTKGEYKATVTCTTNDGPSNAIGTISWNGSKWLVNITGADSGRTVCNVNFNSPFDNKKGVNRPLLATGMTPVVWDGAEFVSTTENNPDWYNYDTKEWANARTQDGSYWVWIPRYAYKITSGYHYSTTGTIEVKFLKGRTNETVDNTTIETEGYISGTKDTSMHYFLHPAFQFNQEELGFWVAKYESSVANQSDACYTSSSPANCNKDTLIPKYIPNATSWRSIQNSNMFAVSENMKNQTAIYGWNASEVDTHMMKNSEWGAVAYLSKSKYGAHTEEVWINSFSSYRTGCSATSASASGSSTCIEYHTENGVKASTTHNIYGVYDMSGGAWEYTSAYVNNGHANLTTYGANIINAQTKYKNIYVMGTTDTRPNNYEANKNVYGDAVYETSSTGENSTSWYGDYSYMPFTSSPFFRRGGDCSYGASAGVFDFRNSGGNVSYNYSWRSAVVVA